MDCDAVFFELTRGPFPAGRPTDLAVEEHLQFCSDCRPLAEALRPAFDIFAESLTAAEGRQLPGYRGMLTAARLVTSPQAESGLLGRVGSPASAASVPDWTQRARHGGQPTAAPAAAKSYLPRSMMFCLAALAVTCAWGLASLLSR